MSLSTQGRENGANTCALHWDKVQRETGIFNSNCDCHRRLLEEAIPEQNLALRMCMYLIKGGGGISCEVTYSNNYAGLIRPEQSEWVPETWSWRGGKQRLAILFICQIQGVSNWPEDNEGDHWKESGHNTVLSFIEDSSWCIMQKGLEGSHTGLRDTSMHFWVKQTRTGNLASPLSYISLTSFSTSLSPNFLKRKVGIAISACQGYSEN